FPTTCLVEADFFTFDFAGVASNQTSLLQRRFERFVVVDECTGDTVAHCTGLTAFAAAMNVDVKVERFKVVGQRQWLTYDHAAGFTGKVLVDGLAVDDDLARSFFQEHASHRGFAAAGS